MQLASEIRVETSGFDASYLLPRRPLGKLRWFALLPIAFGVVFVQMPLWWLLELLAELAQGKLAWERLFVAAFLSVFVLAGLAPLRLGLTALCGRSRIEVRGQRLSVVELFGPVPWPARLPKHRIRALTVHHGAKVNGKPVSTGPLAELGMIVAYFDEGRPRTLVWGYPRAWLEQLASALSVRVGAAGVPAPTVEVVDDNHPEPIDVERKPSDSRVEAQRSVAGISLVIPPAGREGSQGLFGFGIFWCLFMVVFTGVPIAFGKPGDSPPWFAVLFVVVFWGVGLSFIAAGLNMRRRHATLSVEDGALRVKQTTLFGVKEHSWRRGEIAAVRADASGMEVNDRPIVELQIHPTVGKKVGYFAGRDEEELRWIATELRRALKVPPEAAAR